MKKNGLRQAQTLSISKGFAIILVLATLVLLAMLSLTYIKLALIDRNIARNYMDNKRAKLIAQSGVDYAIARMQEDLSGTGWQYKDELNPSFKADEVTINGRLVGYSQVAGNTYDQDIFILKIKDSQGSININDGLGNARVRANLARIINNLVKQNSVIGPASPDIGFDIVGTELDEKRPAGGYSNVSELKRVLTEAYGAIGEDYYKRLEPFVTTHAWQDPNVANPVPLSSAMLGLYPVKYNQNIGIYRYGRGKASDGHVLGTVAGEGIYAQLKFAPEGVTNPWDLEHAIYGLDELNPQWIEIVSRSPVNVNTAPKEVLISLIKDLKGLFVVERKANGLLKRNYNYINFLGNIDSIYYDYTPYPGISNPDAILVDRWYYELQGYPYLESFMQPHFDELGFIYSTYDIDYDFSTDTGLAGKIADEAIKCRNNDPSYSSEWFKGPFKNWRQFNVFCDYLLTKADPDDPSKKILQDTRNIFYEYQYYTEPDVPSGFKVYYRLVPSAIARNYASQALADTLKANFNPNLHLNELNPDANISTLDDKTDLIVNSTEFCFLPMGYFEIESEGFILRSDKVISQSKYKASVKLYDTYRETSQKQFLQGEIPASTANTNNGKRLEIGPEPGEAISRENNWSGYISLPTLRGPGFSADTTTTTSSYKGGTKTVTTTTYPLGRLYSQFTNSFNADYHVDQGTDPTVVENQTQEFESDKTESTVGPYIYGDAGLRKYRLAKGYYYDNGGNVITSDSSAVEAYAPADLRKDGVYIERHNGIAYKSLQNLLEEKGILSYWIKPWFHPEMTGKHRVFASASFVKLVGNQSPFSLLPYYWYPYDFAHWFVSGHVNEADFTTTMEDSLIPWPPLYTTDDWGFRPLSMAFGLSTIVSVIPYIVGAVGDSSGGFGKITPTLNHLSHFNRSCYPDGSSPKTNYARSGQWVHVILLYDKLPVNINEGTNLNWVAEVNEYTEVYVNGGIIPATYDRSDHPINSALLQAHAEEYTGITVGSWIGIAEFYQFYKPKLRLGHPAKLLDTDLAAYDKPTPLTLTCDSTLDEFYVFSALGETKTQTTIDGTANSDGTTTTWSTTDSTVDAFNLVKGMWEQGRYYKPTAQESYFISRDLGDLFVRSKIHPETSIIDPPVPGPVTVAEPGETRKIIGLSWTWFAEGTNTTTGEAILKNYKNFQAADANDPITYLYPAVKVKIKNGAQERLATDDGYSNIELNVSDSDPVQYKVTFELPAPTDAVLLYSPIFDDITIYYTSPVRYVTFTYFE